MLSTYSLSAWQPGKTGILKSPDESLKIKTKHSQMHYESVGISKKMYQGILYKFLGLLQDKSI